MLTQHLGSLVRVECVSYFAAQRGAHDLGQSRLPIACEGLRTIFRSDCELDRPCDFCAAQHRFSHILIDNFRAVPFFDSSGVSCKQQSDARREKFRACFRRYALKKQRMHEA
jgi:hypothetical protein